MTAYISCEALCEKLEAQEGEICLLDVRYQEEFTQEQIIASINIPFDTLDIEVSLRAPNQSVPIVIVAGDEVTATAAADLLMRLGYKDVGILKDGIRAWKDQGHPVFQDMNAESKAFGEFVEHAYDTPNIGPEELFEALQNNWDGVIIDCRPTREHVFSHIPGAIHIPGGDIFQKLEQVTGNENRPVVVHCGGRTRGIIAAQGVVNAGFRNPVQVLTNGTMGWHLCGYELEHGMNAAPVDEKSNNAAGGSSPIYENKLESLNVTELDLAALQEMIADRDKRSVFVFDLRPQDAPGANTSVARHVTAGQLLQATDQFVGVRGARVVLVDDDVVRAKITASWLQQMGWRDAYTHMIEADTGKILNAIAPKENAYTNVERIDVAKSKKLVKQGNATIIDVSQSHEYLAGHIPGAGFCPRGQLPKIIAGLQDSFEIFIITAKNLELSLAAANDMLAENLKILALENGNDAWTAVGENLSIGAERLLGQTPWLNEGFARAVEEKRGLVKYFVDWELERFFDPVKTESIDDAMKKYLKWEIDLVEDWKRDPSLKFKRLVD